MNETSEIKVEGVKLVNRRLTLYYLGISKTGRRREDRGVEAAANFFIQSSAGATTSRHHDQLDRYFQLWNCPIAAATEN